MNSLKEKLKKEVEQLADLGVLIYKSEDERRNPEKASSSTEAKKKLKAKSPNVPLHQSYQSWYSQALPVIKQIIPERYAEFIEQYKLDKRKEIDSLTYTISDYLIGIEVTVTRNHVKEEVVNRFNIFLVKFNHQVLILRSALQRIESTLSDIQGILQAELFDDELGAAEDLLKKGHIRAAGALAGVTLERHLAAVAQSHNIKLTKKNPTIADFNDELRKASVYDVPDWRLIQRLGDLRNMSVHSKEREPTKVELEEMIQGVQKVVKTIF